MLIIRLVVQCYEMSLPTRRRVTQRLMGLYSPTSRRVQGKRQERVPKRIVYCDLKLASQPQETVVVGEFAVTGPGAHGNVRSEDLRWPRLPTATPPSDTTGQYGLYWTPIGAVWRRTNASVVHGRSKQHTYAVNIKPMISENCR